MARGSGTEDYVSLNRWDPYQQLSQLTRAEVDYSRGFLRCAPQQWFPGLAAQWLPLSHALVVELRVQEVKCLLKIPAELSPQIAYQGSIDEENVALMMDDHAMRVILNAASPDGLDVAHSIVLEYLVRRILTSLALSFSASEPSIFKFEKLVDPATVEGAGLVRVSVQINNENCAVWFSLGPRMVERMDGLWRRHLLSRSRGGEGEGEYLVELAQLGVPPAQVAQYVRSGAVIDLEVPLSDRVVLRRRDGGAFPARIAGVGDELTVELQPGSAPLPAVGAGMTRVSVCFGRLSMSAADFTELQQPGAISTTGIALSDNLQMVINGERVADVLLGIYQGRFAVQVK